MVPAEMLAEFHEALGDEPGRGNASLRLKLHREEHRELQLELGEPCLLPNDEIEWRAYPDDQVDRAKLARELADVVYIAYGTAHAFDIDLDAALIEIHRAAMEKVRPRCGGCEGSGWGRDRVGRICRCSYCGGSGLGERVVRDDGKVLKPAGFVEPDMSVAVGHSWRKEA